MDVSANILQIGLRPFGKSFLLMKNRNDPKTEPCGMPETIIFRDEHWPSNKFHSLFSITKVVFQDSQKITFYSIRF